MPRLVNGLEQIFTNLGIVGDGYKLFFFETTTTTPKTTYSNVGLTVQNPNPVVCDEAGRPESDIWGADLSTYKMVLGTPDSVIGNINPIVTVDPVNDLNEDSIINLDPLPAAYWGTTTGTSTNYILAALVPITSYSYKYCFFVDFHIACAANPNLDVNDIGVINLKKYTGQGTKVSLLAGDVQPQRYLVIIDGVDAVVLNPRSQVLYLGTPPIITIASGVGTLPNSASNYLFDTEGAGTTDDLDTINGGVDGQKITNGNVADARNIIIKHNTGNIINPAGIDIALDITSNKVEMIYSGALSKWIVTSAPSLAPILYIQDQKPNGTDGGASSAGMNIRVLNTVLSNTISGASLASNQITLPAGTFAIDATAPCFGANGNKAYLYNVTDSANSLLGTSNYNADTIGVQSFSRVIGILTIASAKVFELRQYIETGLGSGLGASTSAGQTEVYSQILIKKIA